MKATSQWVGASLGVILLSIAAVASYGADYYVDGTTGIDSPARGTKAQPWKSINYALGRITGSLATPHRVLVAGGNYAENVVVGPHESIYGGHNPVTWAREPATNLTTIRAPAAGSVVVLGEQSVVDGFTLRNGNRDYGGGVYCQNVTATVSNCHITQNQATRNASAVYVTGGNVQITSNVVEQNTIAPTWGTPPACAILVDGGSASLQDNVIQETVSGSGVCGKNADVHLQGDRILRNQGYGVYTTGGTVTASDCVVCENTLTGICVWEGSLHQCTVCRNNTEGYGAGGIESFRSVLVEACVICQSRRDALSGKFSLANSVVLSNRTLSSFGGTVLPACDLSGGTVLSNSLFVNNGALKISEPVTSTNNTLVKNASGYSISYMFTPTNIRITNDILWENGDDIAFPASQANQTNVTYCNISNGDFSGSNGNISVNPDFVGQVGAGTMSQVKYDRQNCRTVLTDTGANYRPGALARTFLWTSDTAFYVETNTATEITVYGDITQVASAGFKYTIIDYHLQPSSLCVDAGTNVGAPDHDFEGDLRPLRGRTSDTADMGADEYNPKGKARCRTFPVGDLNEDCVVDMRDLALLLSHWLESSIQE